MQKIINDPFNKPAMIAVMDAAARVAPNRSRNEDAIRRRDRETAALRRFVGLASHVIATGGGAVIREENRRMFRENSRTLLLTRPMDQLPKEGRPLSQLHSAAELWEKRKSFYTAAAEYTLEAGPTPEDTLEDALALLFPDGVI